MQLVGLTPESGRAKTNGFRDFMRSMGSLHDLAQQVDQRLVRLVRLRREAGHDVAEVVLLERRLLVELREGTKT